MKFSHALHNLTARIPGTQSMTSSTTTTSDEPPTKKQKTMTPALISPTTSPAVPQKAFEQVSLLVQKLSSKGRLPTRGSPMSAGYDLYSYVILASVLPFLIRFCPVWGCGMGADGYRAEETVVPAKGKALIATDLSIACPPGTYGRVAPRSGLGPTSQAPQQSFLTIANL